MPVPSTPSFFAVYSISYCFPMCASQWEGALVLHLKGTPQPPSTEEYLARARARVCGYLNSRIIGQKVGYKLKNIQNVTQTTLNWCDTVLWCSGPARDLTNALIHVSWRGIMYSRLATSNLTHFEVSFVRPTPNSRSLRRFSGRAMTPSPLRSTEPLST